MAIPGVLLVAGCLLRAVRAMCFVPYAMQVAGAANLRSVRSAPEEALGLHRLHAHPSPRANCRYQIAMLKAIQGTE